MRGRQAARSYYYYHFDGLGSVIALSDKDGDVVEVYNYDVYGAGIDEPVMMVVVNRSADITGAGGVNAADLTDFADAWLSIAAPRYSAFDYNQDGYIGFDDLDWLCQKWLSAGGTDFEDFAQFASLWLTETGTSPDPDYDADADLYADGRIDFADFAVLAEYWLTSGERSDDYYYYHFDGLGSVIALSDEDGDVVEVYNYDVYGQAEKVSSVDNPYLFAGRRWDREAKLYYYRARMYNPSIGRFLQVDPIGYEGSMNLYQYCLNNPLILIDPSGTNVFGGIVSWIAGSGFDISVDMGKREALQLGSAALEGAGKGAAAWADGVIPFGDPLKGVYANNNGSVDSVYKFSQAMGHISRDAALAAAVPNLAAWTKNPAMYEAGSTTVTPAVYNSIKGLSAVEKGRKLVSAAGGGIAGWTKVATGTTWSQIGSTIGTGLTPGGYLLGIGVLEAADIGWGDNDRTSYEMK